MRVYFGKDKLTIHINPYLYSALKAFITFLELDSDAARFLNLNLILKLDSCCSLIAETSVPRPIIIFNLKSKLLAHLITRVIN